MICELTLNSFSYKQTLSFTRAQSHMIFIILLIQCLTHPHDEKVHIEELAGRRLSQFSMTEEPRYANCTICFPS